MIWWGVISEYVQSRVYVAYWQGHGKQYMWGSVAWAWRCCEERQVCSWGRYESVSVGGEGCWSQTAPAAAARWRWHLPSLVRWRHLVTNDDRWWKKLLLKLWKTRDILVDNVDDYHLLCNDIMIFFTFNHDFLKDGMVMRGMDVILLSLPSHPGLRCRCHLLSATSHFQKISLNRYFEQMFHSWTFLTFFNFLTNYKDYSFFLLEDIHTSIHCSGKRS